MRRSRAERRPSNPPLASIGGGARAAGLLFGALLLAVPARAEGGLVLVFRDVAACADAVEPRTGALLDELNRANADVLVLAGVSPAFFYRLQDASWIQANYRTDAVPASLAPSGGVAVFVRAPFSAYPPPGSRGGAIRTWQLSGGGAELYLRIVLAGEPVEAQPAPGDELRVHFDPTAISDAWRQAFPGAGFRTLSPEGENAAAGAPSSPAAFLSGSAWVAKRVAVSASGDAVPGAGLSVELVPAP